MISSRMKYPIFHIKTTFILLLIFLIINLLANGMSKKAQSFFDHLHNGGTLICYKNNTLKYNKSNETYKLSSNPIPYIKKGNYLVYNKDSDRVFDIIKHCKTIL